MRPVLPRWWCTAVRFAAWAAVTSRLHVDAVRPVEAFPYRSESATAAVPRLLKVHSQCQTLYEYSNFLGEINNVTYTGSQKPQPNIGQFNTPMFDNPELRGDPVGRFRGSYLEDVVAHFATFVAAVEFFGAPTTSKYLVVSLGFPTLSISAGTGVALGGTGLWSDYRGTVVSEPFNASWTSDDSVGGGTAVPIVFRYTICP
jgi:hypothetical protein